jgi:hypothetical protein
VSFAHHYARRWPHGSPRGLDAEQIRFNAVKTTQENCPRSELSDMGESHRGEGLACNHSRKVVRAKRILSRFQFSLGLAHGYNFKESAHRQEEAER